MQLYRRESANSPDCIVFGLPCAVFDKGEGMDFDGWPEIQPRSQLGQRLDPADRAPGSALSRCTLAALLCSRVPAPGLWYPKVTKAEQIWGWFWSPATLLHKNAHALTLSFVCARQDDASRSDNCDLCMCATLQPWAGKRCSAKLLGTTTMR